ncbi:MAG: hypothetical protein IJ412_06365 [Oscillospiraceae bacterium]|nr:hypothetical protein [Oscillospiraceae bacterium]
MKKRTVFVLVLACLFVLAGCSTKSMNYIIGHRPSVSGTVYEVREDSFLVYAEKAEGYPNGSHWSFSLQPENADSYTAVVVGDEVTVYHDGNVMESDPLRVGKVYAITLINPADRSVNEKS